MRLEFYSRMLEGGAGGEEDHLVDALSLTDEEVDILRCAAEVVYARIQCCGRNAKMRFESDEDAQCAAYIVGAMCNRESPVLKLYNCAPARVCRLLGQLGCTSEDHLQALLSECRSDPDYLLDLLENADEEEGIVFSAVVSQLAASVTMSSVLHSEHLLGRVKSLKHLLFAALMKQSSFATDVNEATALVLYEHWRSHEAGSRIQTPAESGVQMHYTGVTYATYVLPRRADLGLTPEDAAELFFTAAAVTTTMDAHLVEEWLRLEEPRACTCKESFTFTIPNQAVLQEYLGVPIAGSFVLDLGVIFSPRFAPMSPMRSVLFGGFDVKMWMTFRFKGPDVWEVCAMTKLDLPAIVEPPEARAKSMPGRLANGVSLWTHVTLYGSQQTTIAEGDSDANIFEWGSGCESTCTVWLGRRSDRELRQLWSDVVRGTLQLSGEPLSGRPLVQVKYE